MKQNPRKFFLTAVVILCAASSFCSSVVTAQEEKGTEKTDTQPVYRLEVKNADEPELKPVVEALQKNFKTAYPQLIKRFGNPEWSAPKTIVVNFKKAMDHPAHAAGNELTFSTEWFLKHPDDIGCLSHEATHIVQHYRPGAIGWMTEGIADYSRFLYGPDGPGDAWQLPSRVRPTDSYTQAYRVTARFLLWIEKKYDPKFVDKANRKLQAGTFKIEDFKSLTGKTPDELWAEYAADKEFKPERPGREKDTTKTL